MNSKQTKTKCAVFAQPTPKNITWNEVVSMLLALECVMAERDGSRVAFTKNNEVLHLHRPHPENTLKIYKVQQVRNFLLRIGEMP